MQMSRQWVSCHQVSDRESPTSAWTQSVRRQNKLMTGRRTKMMPWGSRRNWGGMCSEIPRASSIQTATHKHTELTLDAFRCIKPLELRMYQLLQTAVELPGANNHTSCHVQHSVQLVSGSFWSPGKNDVAVDELRHHKGVHHVIADSIQPDSDASWIFKLWIRSNPDPDQGAYSWIHGLTCDITNHLQQMSHVGYNLFTKHIANLLVAARMRYSFQCRRTLLFPDGHGPFWWNDFNFH